MNDDVLNALELLQKVNTDLSYDMICKTSDEQKLEYHKKLETFLKYNSMKAKDANAPKNLNGLKGAKYLKRTDLIHLLEMHGWYLKRPGSRHDIYTNGVKCEPIPRHREINELTAKSIIKRTGV